MHIAAEQVTALALIAGGVGILRRARWARDIYLLATGGLVYTLIQSPGYYLQQGVVGFVLLFAVLLVITLGLLRAMIAAGGGRG